MNRQQILQHNVFFLFIALLFSIVCVSQTEANTTSNVNTTVKVSICGNGLKEGGEDCDQANLGGKTCTQLGYAGGNLSCDNSCSFETVSCLAPTITATAISPTHIGSLLAVGFFDIPNTASIISSPSLTATRDLTIQVPVANGQSSIVLPKDVVITRSDGSNLDPTALTASAVTPTSLSGLSTGTLIDGALQWGIPNATLLFSTPISLSIAVGTSLNGQTLTILRSDNPTSGWTNDGIIAPATCTVVAGLCNFQATKASYFATIRPGTNTSSSTNATNTSTTSTNANTSPSTISTPTLPIQNVFNKQPSTTRTITTLPDFVQLFDLDKNGNIEVTEVSQAIQAWVTARQTSQHETCDINSDKLCDIQDLSILLFYVEK